MGQVWSAVHVVTGRRVAIKRLLLAAAEGDEQRDSQARARFILEAQMACAVEHVNVVQVLDFVEHNDEPPLLVMELLEGETLAAKLEREHALSLEETLRVLLPVVSAVGTAHALGIIHRDLKPANIFLQQRGASDRIVKVLDFGIAKWVAQQPTTATGLRTQTGSTLGTPCYMAPEQAIGERVIDHTADIWSLGIILYECLAGARPVDGENAVQMVVRLLNTGIMPIECVVPTLPSDVAQLIGRMLSRDAARRPRDLREVFEILRPHADVSAPPFGAPSLAGESAKHPSARVIETASEDQPAPDSKSTIASATFVSAAAQSGMIDANAATLRDDSQPPNAAPSWQGQSVSSQVRSRSSWSSRRLLALLSIPAVALFGYVMLRASASANTHVPLSPLPIVAKVASESKPAPEIAASPTRALPEPTAPELTPPAASSKKEAPAPVVAAKSAPRPKLRPPPSKDDGDGTSDRK